MFPSYDERIECKSFGSLHYSLVRGALVLYHYNTLTSDIKYVITQSQHYWKLDINNEWFSDGFAQYKFNLSAA